MRKAQQAKFDLLYQKHVNALKRQGKSKATIDAYSMRIPDQRDRSFRFIVTDSGTIPGISGHIAGNPGHDPRNLI
jgi:hypothetical protein